jgi:hypothetical protein
MQEIPKSKRFNLVNQEHYEVDLEYNDQYAIIHLPRVSKFNRSVYLDMVDKLKSIADFLKDGGYFGLWVAFKPEDITLGKLVEKLGFVYLGSSDGLVIHKYGDF